MISLLKEQNSNSGKTEFYLRYRSFLLHACKIRCKNFDDGDQLANDIFQNSILKAFNGFESLYDIIKGNPTNIDEKTKAWLAVIAKNELREFLRKNPDEKRLSNPFREKSEELEMTRNEEQKNVKSNIYKQTLDEALAHLSDRESHILMVYMEYFDPDQPQRHLPDEVIKELCKKYETNSANLRQIKKRALKKLMDSINRNSN